MEISKTLAERTLRECHGDVVEALVALTNWETKIEIIHFSSKINEKKNR